MPCLVMSKRLKTTDRLAFPGYQIRQRQWTSQQPQRSQAGKTPGWDSMCSSINGVHQYRYNVASWDWRVRGTAIGCDIARQQAMILVRPNMIRTGYLGSPARYSLSLYIFIYTNLCYCFHIYIYIYIILGRRHGHLAEYLQTEDGSAHDHDLSGGGWGHQVAHTHTHTQHTQSQFPHYQHPYFQGESQMPESLSLSLPLSLPVSLSLSNSLHVTWYMQALYKRIISLSIPWHVQTRSSLSRPTARKRSHLSTCALHMVKCTHASPPPAPLGPPSDPFISHTIT